MQHITVNDVTRFWEKLGKLQRELTEGNRKHSEMDQISNRGPPQGGMCSFYLGISGNEWTQSKPTSIIPKGP